MYLSEGGDATLLKNDVSQNWNSFQLAVHLLTLFVRLGQTYLNILSGIPLLWLRVMTSVKLLLRKIPDGTEPIKASKS